MPGSLKENLPSKKNFYSLLTGKSTSDKEYEHVIKNGNKFEMKTMKGFNNFYLKCDVLLLVDVFEKFRNSSLKKFGSCSSHYLSASTLNMYEMLNSWVWIKVEFDLYQT